ncbi:MAG: sigma-54 dependent transcriptional regulator [Deltaproteobacteria bacterium]|jgi:two-component system response regulator FlrC|nr:sigma-54 dependent transcriptional regulator [Deltaproteobacteria bacterium]
MKVRYILVADGERHFRMALFTALTRLGHGVELAEDSREALDKFCDQKFDLVLVDASLPKTGGLALIKELKRLRSDVPVIAMSGGGVLDEAVSFMREGAQDYLSKPFPNGVVEQAVQRAVASSDDIESASKDARTDGLGPERPIVAKSAVMRRLMGLAVNLKGSAATVLLQGESGTGKELMARYIHQNSLRSDGPFVAINCAGLPENLLESELFGHEKGAFTGAMAKKPGKFDLANGGTILLDEISEMDINIQAKLLRALQEGEIDPVGGKGPHKIDVRVIATTNRKLKEWVDAGKFRADLFYRLNVMPFFIPALRERSVDIEVLAEHFVSHYALENHKNISGLTSEALDILAAHDWPGNIRELENTMARAVLMARGNKIEAHDIFMDEAGFLMALEKNAELMPKNISEKNDFEKLTPEKSAADSGYLGASPELEVNGEALPLMTITEMERCLIGKALNETSGNRTHAAKILGISVRTLRNKLAEYRENPEHGYLGNIGASRDDGGCDFDERTISSGN